MYFILIIFTFIILIILSPVASIKRKDQMKKYYGTYYHRGFYDNRTTAENSLAAFKQCADRHYGIELDVQFTKDHKIIVFHDDDLLRMCGINKEVKKTSYEDIKKLCLLETADKIPLFSDALKTINSRVPVYVELKGYDRDYKLLADQTVKLIRAYPGKYLLCSFNPLILYYLRKHYPEYLRGMIAGGNSRENIIATILSYMLLNWLVRPDFISYDYRKETWPLKLNRHLGRTLAAWAPDKPEEYKKIKDNYQLFIIEHFDPKEGSHE